MISVILKFKDGDYIQVTLESHVFQMWLTEMKGSLAKYAEIEFIDDLGLAAA